MPYGWEKILNPIIDWSDDDVWEFILKFKIRYCELYDAGARRLGCIGCPMATDSSQNLEKYPTYKRAYLRAFEKMLKNGAARGIKFTWENADEVMNWWIKQR